MGIEGKELKDKGDISITGGQPGDLPVASMHQLFRSHDLGTAGGGISDAQLFAGLSLLPLTTPIPYPVWGLIYHPINYDLDDSGPDDTHFSYIVKVSRLSVLSGGGRFLWGWRDMPLTEYARRQAVIGAAVLSILPN